MIDDSPPPATDGNHRIGELVEIPMHIVLHAFLFVCVLSLRDVIKATLDLIPIPKTNIYWLWMETLLQITIGCLIIFVLAYMGWIDPHAFKNG